LGLNDKIGIGRFSPLDNGANLTRGRAAAAALISPPHDGAVVFLVGEDEAPGLAKQSEEFFQVSKAQRTSSITSLFFRP